MIYQCEYRGILAAVLGRLCTCLGRTGRRWVSQSLSQPVPFCIFLLGLGFIFDRVYFVGLLRYVEGELLDGRRGLIPSNYVTKLVGCHKI